MSNMYECVNRSKLARKARVCRYNAIMIMYMTLCILFLPFFAVLYFFTLFFDSFCSFSFSTVVFSLFVVVIHTYIRIHQHICVAESKNRTAGFYEQRRKVEIVSIKLYQGFLKRLN